MNLVRGSARRHTTRSAASTACTWITRFARSTPTRVICSTDFPFPRFQIDDFEHHQSWRLDAVARNVGSPSHSARADLQRLGPRCVVVHHPPRGPSRRRPLSSTLGLFTRREVCMERARYDRILPPPPVWN